MTRKRRKKRAWKAWCCRLGGSFEVVSHDRSNNLADVLVARANEYHATQLIIGQCDRPVWKRFGGSPMIKKLLRTARHMDILIVANYDPHIKRDTLPPHGEG